MITIGHMQQLATVVHLEIDNSNHNIALSISITQSAYYEPPAFGSGGELYGEPRMYGVRVRYNFGAHAK